VKFLLFFFLISSATLLVPLKAQDADTAWVSNYDSLLHHVVAAEEDQDAPADSSAIQPRSFDKSELQKLKDDADLHYKEPPTVAETLWDRFLHWMGELIQSIFSSAFDTTWGNLIVYVFGLALVIILVMMLLKVDAFRVLFSAEGGKLKHQVPDENIHEMDFDQLIREAVQKQDYRRGIRLLFLYSLKLLSDKHFIRWENGKTNHEYLAELKEKELQKGFNELSFYFDYAWYGNFTITADTFEKAERVFTSWKQKVS
jgi:hypothetical protein